MKTYSEKCLTETKARINSKPNKVRIKIKKCVAFSKDEVFFVGFYKVKTTLWGVLFSSFVWALESLEFRNFGIIVVISEKKNGEFAMTSSNSNIYVKAINGLSFIFNL